MDQVSAQFNNFDFFEENLLKKGVSGRKQKKRISPLNPAYLIKSRYQISL